MGVRDDMMASRFEYEEVAGGKALVEEEALKIQAKAEAEKQAIIKAL